LQIDSAELLAPHASLSTARYGFAKRLAYHVPVTLNPVVKQFREGTHSERHTIDERVRLTSIVACKKRQPPKPDFPPAFSMYDNE
jgi:hypothetical protein